MNDEETLVGELRCLKRQAQMDPSNWVFGRIAELEGLLAATKEKAAWETAGNLLAKFRSADK